MVKDNVKRITGATKAKLDDDVNALFKLPLAEFIDARKTLTTQLKKAGRASEADEVKRLAKPPISAWAVNQLYWNHREAFDQLIASGQRFRKAQTSRQSAKIADMREALEMRREALADLSDLASGLLSEAGHNPSLDTIRRVTATLEALSAYEVIPDEFLGRLTQDVDPPGFESMGAFTPSPGATKPTAKPQVGAPNKSASTKTRKDNRVEETRQSRIAAARVSLQDAKKLLVAARAKAQSLITTQKKTEAASKEAEKKRREAEKQFQKASANAEEASRRAKRITTEVGEATKELEDAERTVKEASQELESLFRQSPAR